ncbi:hypothetical protein B0T26DRAFT_802952 [Lasiosphaeria miniovina]|uniref:Uncharacterized protein n=1 Tax=Lasiosphaeria miniovina TaxID=1954250 RepID=A0AA40ALH9_9PEZI|nr:uncharacterized protein B0T26DRAFT_802952 [Lasiosphaeria miniovina]KAK0717990.1 hypothetical protein B0T26DRAFT_802952 [Lasiosphaeria miniovina]
MAHSHPEPKPSQYGNASRPSVTDYLISLTAGFRTEFQSGPPEVKYSMFNAKSNSKVSREEIEIDVGWPGSGQDPPTSGAWHDDTGFDPGLKQKIETICGPPLHFAAHHSLPNLSPSGNSRVSEMPGKINKGMQSKLNAQQNRDRNVSVVGAGG